MNTHVSVRDHSPDHPEIDHSLIDLHQPLYHYALASLLFILYGGQVCPFLDTLTPVQLLAPLLLTFGLQLAARTLLATHVADSTPPATLVRRLFTLDIILFALGGVALGLFNTVVYDFPLESAIKVLVGFGALGFFIATDLALSQEYRLFEWLEARGSHLPLGDERFPVTRKFTVFASCSALVTLGTLFLVINKDLHWLRQVGQGLDAEQAQWLVLVELAFVVGVILGYQLRVIMAYARNLGTFVDSERVALAAAAAGHLEARVPVGSNDEFGEIAARTNHTISSLAEHRAELQRTQEVTILALASLAETRDNETGAHILRTQHYVRLLATEMACWPEYHAVLSDDNIELMFKSAPLHDIGKVGVPDAILLKPGKLSDEEFQTVQQHTVLGAQALKAAIGEHGATGFLRFACEIAEFHHERWDGAGYPQGLKGEEIPLSARLMAVADVYDALISKRAYKAAMSREAAEMIILEGRGKQFAPDVVDAFCTLREAFADIAATYRDD